MIERRWIVLCTDGRHVTLGRARCPSEAEVDEAAVQLQAQGLAGWFAVMEGNPYVGPLPTVSEVRPLAGPVTSFAAAAEDFRRQIEDTRKELG